MLCQYCNAPLADNAKFCTSCGQAIVVAPVPPTVGKPKKTLLIVTIGIVSLLLIAAGVGGGLYYADRQQAEEQRQAAERMREYEVFSQKAIQEMEENSRQAAQNMQAHHEAIMRGIRGEDGGESLIAEKWAKVEQVFLDALECRKELPYKNVVVRAVFETPNHWHEVTPPTDFRVFGLPVTEIGATLNYGGGEGIYYSSKIQGYTFDQIAKAANLKISQEQDTDACYPGEDECYANAPLIWVASRETHLVGTTGDLDEGKDTAWLSISVQPEKRNQQKTFELTCYIYYPAP